MERRKFGKLGFDVSLLGFGCMRLPRAKDPSPDSDVGEIDKDEAISLIRHAIDNGVDYIDTAYPYHGGKSEILVGHALKDGYRNRVKLATKLPTWSIKAPEDCDARLNEQLEKLKTDYLDLYLVHALNKDFWKIVKEQKVFEFLDRVKKEGKVRAVGFSFHDDLDLFREIVDAYDWDFCQIQLNYMDEEYQAGVEGLRYAAAKGLAVVVMEPLRGGKLVKDIPQEVEEFWKQADVKRTPAEWALRWVANFPEVSVILSGMGAKEEVDENIKTMSLAKPNSLSEKELALISKAKDFYNQRTKVKCTNCRYCMPCPSGVDIPGVFEVYNNAYIYNAHGEGKWQYGQLTKNGADASKCVECGQCESKCPQNLTIIQYLKDAHAYLA